MADAPDLGSGAERRKSSSLFVRTIFGTPFSAVVAQLVERHLAKVEVASPSLVYRSTCGCSSMVELQPSKLVTWVRFPSPAPAQRVALHGLTSNKTVRKGGFCFIRIFSFAAEGVEWALRSPAEGLRTCTFSVDFYCCRGIRVCGRDKGAMKTDEVCARPLDPFGIAALGKSQLDNSRQHPAEKTPRPAY